MYYIYRRIAKCRLTLASLIYRPLAMYMRTVLLCNTLNQVEQFSSLLQCLHILQRMLLSFNHMTEY
jgi:hypothetical protein